MDKQYPHIPCLRPIRIKNPCTDEIQIVPCGHCKACQLKKSSLNSLLTSLESTESKFCFFVTLTYSNEYVPTMKPVFDKEKNIVLFQNLCDRNTDEIVTFDLPEYHRGSLNGYYALLMQKAKLDGVLPYLYKRDVQLFNKRLRKHLSKYTNEKIRYYIVGEYGPRTFRPHYHCLYFFDSTEIFDVFTLCVRKAWQYGRIDSQLSKGQCASYCAKYVNNYSCIPRFYQCLTAKPFQLHSTNMASRQIKANKDKIYEDVITGTLSFSYTNNGKPTSFNPWRSLENNLFPRCYQYANKSIHQLYKSYTILQLAQEHYKTDNIGKLSQLIHKDDTFNAVTSEFLYKENADSIAILMPKKEIIASRLYLSKHFLNFICDGNTTYHNIMYHINVIIKYYKDKDYEQLKEQYSFQETYFSTDGDIYELPYFYDNLLDKDIQQCTNTFLNTWCENNNILPAFVDDLDISKSRLYKRFSADCDNRYRKNIKHKELNDLNQIFIY